MKVSAHVDAIPAHATIGTILTQGIRLLTEAGVDSAEQEAVWILESALALSSLHLRLNADRRLTPDEQAVFLRGLTKVIHSLQSQGVIAVARMCAGCTYFQPYVHADTAKPHHCGLVNKPMGEGQLRLDCPDFVPGGAVEVQRRWDVFVTGGEGR